VPEPKAGKNRLHLDLVTAGSMEAEVARLSGAGAEVVEVRRDPESPASPDGVHHLHGVGHPRIGAAIVSPVGRR
jgi:hypothetical protein